MARWSRYHALLFIALSTLAVSGSATVGYWGYHYWKAGRMRSPACLIQSIEQKGGLPTNYLAELLGLSVDQPTNLYALDLIWAKQTLEASPVIKWAEVGRIPPSTLFIEYEARAPIATLSQLSNRAIDEEGAILPMAPFYEDCGLPEVLLGDMYHTLNLLHLLLPRPGHLERIDTTRLAEESSGRREIILVVDGYYVRLPPDGYEEVLEDFDRLRPKLSDPPLVIDMRLPHLAYLSSS